MLLNALQNQFLIRFPKSFFYTEIHDKWTPVIKRLKLPYESLEDFMNAAVQSLNFPAIDLPIQEQPQQQFRIAYRPGKELELTDFRRKCLGAEVLASNPGTNLIRI